MRRRSRGWWIGIVRDLESSGLSHGEFAARRGINVGTLRVWLYRLREEASKQRGEAPALLPVRVIRSAALKARDGAGATAQIEVGLPNGICLRFAPAADLDYVAALIQKLR